MKYFAWDAAKLREGRSIGFENIVFHIERGDLLDILEPPNRARYAWPGQRFAFGQILGDPYALWRRGQAAMEEQVGHLLETG